MNNTNNANNDGLLKYGVIDLVECPKCKVMYEPIEGYEDMCPCCKKEVDTNKLKNN